MKSELAVATSIFLLFLVVCSQSASGVSSGKWYYWMEPGVYARYAYFQTQESGQYFYFTNRSIAMFANFTLAWQVIEVHDMYATVNYNFTFYSVKAYPSEDITSAPGVDVGNLTFSITLTVRLDTLELVDDGKSWGRWPYWVHGWEVGKNITLIHDYPPSPAWRSGEPTNVTAYLNGPESETEGFDTPAYNFSRERLLRTSTNPYHIEKIKGNTAKTWATYIDAYYDSVSLIFLGMSTKIGGEEIADDVLYHKFGVWDVVYCGNILLADSNINFDPSKTPDEAPTMSPLLIVGIATVAILPILGVALRKRRKRRRK
jgi:hypothetical protein